jgi:hypothetical protein
MPIGNYRFQNTGGIANLGQGINEGVEGGLQAYRAMREDRRAQQDADLRRGAMAFQAGMPMGGAPQEPEPSMPGASALATHPAMAMGGEGMVSAPGTGVPSAGVYRGFEVETLPQQQPDASAIATTPPPSAWAPQVGEQDLERMGYEAQRNLAQRQTQIGSADDVVRNAYPLVRQQSHLEKQMQVLDGALNEYRQNPKDPSKWIMLNRLFPGAQDPTVALSQASQMQREFLSEYNENKDELGPLMEAAKKYGIPNTAFKNKAAMLEYQNTLQQRARQGQGGRMTGPTHPLLRRGYGHR